MSQDQKWPERSYADLHDHLDRLRQAGLLYEITEPVNKDTQMHPLVRWQFVGGIAEEDRKGFLFNNIVDGSGRKYPMRVVIGALASNPEIYRLGINVASLEDIGTAWTNAIANPVPPRLVEHGQCQEFVITGKDLEGEGNGVMALPIPISTPGFDAAPYFTAACVITKDPDTGVQNVGTYRGQLKAPTRIGMMMLENLRAGGLQHWKKWRAKGLKMPIAIVVGCPPIINFQGPQKLPLEMDELSVAGALAGGPINVVRGKTVDLLIPAESEVVVEGEVEIDFLEPEGPFGESHGYVALEDYNLAINVKAITHRRDPIITSFISQVTPSESSVVKKLAYEPLFLDHLKKKLGIKGVKRVALHEPLTNLRKVVLVQVKRGTPRTEIWRALQGTMTLQAAIGKFVIAIDEDIDPDNADAVFWALAYRCNPAEDTLIIPNREPGHGPMRGGTDIDSAMLIDATMKHDMPPIALPKKPYMEDARALWEKLGLPKLRPQNPWYGYSLGEWTDKWDRNAAEAADGKWLPHNADYIARRNTSALPNSPVPQKPKDGGK